MDPSGRLCRNAFTAALVLFAYGTLFPFHFDLQPGALSEAWSQVRLLPYWDAARGRIHSLPDIVANILLGMPVGFFGFLWWGRGRRQSVWTWGLVGLGLGAAVEVLQLAIPYRTTSITDALNDALGAQLGALAGRLFGPQILAPLTGAWEDPGRTRAALLLGFIVLLVLGPMDLTLDIADLRSDLESFRLDPWGSNGSMGDEWLAIAAFALFGAVAAKLVFSGGLPPSVSKPRGIALILLVPWVVELGQLFIASRTPSVRESLLGFLAVTAGLLVGRHASSMANPRSGLVVVTVALIAAGSSPFEFARPMPRFQWVPLLEYYLNTNAGALYDAGVGLLGFALLAALLRASFGGSRFVVVTAAVCVAAAIEILQIFIPARYPGTTDITIAALGALMGDTVESNIEKSEMRGAAARKRNHFQ